MGPGSSTRHSREAYLVLIEPVREFSEGIAKLLESHAGEHLQWRSARVSGSAVLHVDPRGARRQLSPEAGGGAPRSTESARSWSRPWTSCGGGEQWTPPFGLKLDVEGNEHRAVEGAAELLGETQFVIAEVSVASDTKTGTRSPDSSRRWTRTASRCATSSTEPGRRTASSATSTRCSAGLSGWPAVGMIRRHG